MANYFEIEQGNQPHISLSTLRNMTEKWFEKVGMLRDRLCQKTAWTNTQLVFHHSLCLLAFLGILAGLYVGFFRSRDIKVNASITTETEVKENPSPAAQTSKEKTQEFPEVVVDMSGAVVTPGIYHLKKSARILEAVEEAGGFSSNADTFWIAHHLNLAERISDAQKIFIPAVGDQSEKEAINPLPTDSGQDMREMPSLNTVPVEVLNEVKGLGEKRVADIVAGRPYVSWEDFQQKVKLPQATLAALKEAVELTP